MRYLWPVTDLADHPALAHLTAAEARLGSALARPRAIATACIVALTAFGWLALGLMAADGPLSWQALCRPGAPGGIAGALLAFPMWAAMTLAMMLPTAGPTILTYAEIADTAVRKREPVVSPLVLTAGYLAVWLGFALLAAFLQQGLARTGLLDGGGNGQMTAGVIFVGAGLYQFSPLKQACLTLCRQPFPFFFANWTTERGGVLRLGVRQGLYCLGCCGALMLLMFAAGTMNVVWMAALGVAMTVEKMTSGKRVSEALGGALLVAGLAFVAAAIG
jgi:predicted metal-binding membrane protein